VSEAELTSTAISALANLLIAGAAIAAAIAAFLGLSTWQAQNIWVADRELARALLKSIVKLERTVASARSPMFWAGETAEFESAAKGNRRDASDLAHYARLNSIHAVYQEIEAHMIEAEAVWGAAIDTEWKKVSQELSHFFAETQLYLSWKTAGQPRSIEGFFGDEAGRQRNYAKVFVAPGDEEANPFSQSFTSATGDLKSKLRIKLGKPK
jgi:hypothetical protein